ncbi:MAG: TIGR01777 family protein [Proteobacteria bacterium]|nr:TIGR01777 family protein [Pseudomonadota bacterium]
MPVNAKALYDWHASGGAFERLVPSWESMCIDRWQGGEDTQNLSKAQQWGDISKGALISIVLKKGPLKLNWTAKHTDSDRGHFFVDQQLSGPFAHWEHRHLFHSIDEQQSILEDQVSYKLPLKPVSRLMQPWVERQLRAMFAFRHIRTSHDISMYQKYPFASPLKIAITGASGLLGRQLVAFLRGGGHRIFPMVRRSTADQSDEIQWSIDGFDPKPLEGMDAVIHLAGEPILGWWTKRKKERILRSRVQGTQVLVDAFSKLQHPPKTFISASAIGFYGNVIADECFEDSACGAGFLAQVCQEWENTALRAANMGIRVVLPRIGIVLSGAGGALKQMLLPFYLGAGGRVGDGNQWMSCIALDDLLSMFLFALNNKDVEGALNCVSPNPIQNKEFTYILGKVLNRPTFIPLPKFAVRLLLGEMGEALLLQGAKVIPRKALDLGFEWSYRETVDALRLETGNCV